MREVDVPSLPPRQKHPTIFRLLDELAVGDVLRITNDHDPLPLRHALERNGGGSFAFEYVESGPTVWRVDIRKLGAGPAPRTRLEFGPTILPPTNDDRGDPACWLHLVCGDCGAVVDGPAGHRPGCASFGGVTGPP